MRGIRFHHGLIALVLCAQLGCGTILYPDRRGQGAGRIDAGVAVLDGIGLLFFLVPGVIAFAVDFATGAIYLPGGRRRLASTTATVERIDLPDPSLAGIEAALHARGIDVDLAHAVRITPSEPVEDLADCLAALAGSPRPHDDHGTGRMVGDVAAHRTEHQLTDASPSA